MTFDKKSRVPVPDEDVGKLMGDRSLLQLSTCVPLSSIKVEKPDDMPCIEDWLTTTISFLFNGSRLHREPLDLNVDQSSLSMNGETCPFLKVKKGFTRLHPGSSLVCCHCLVIKL